MHKSLDNMEENELYSITQPYASFEQTTGVSSGMSNGITYIVKPVAGGAPLNIWDSIITKGGITINNNGVMSFSQSGQYMAVFKGSISQATEIGRIKFQLVKVGAASNQFWIYDHKDINVSSSTRITSGGMYDVKAGDTFEFRVTIDDMYTSLASRLIARNRLTVYFVG